MLRITLILSFVFSLCPATAFADDDIVIADFESETYVNWKVEGEAFGLGPARGTLSRQMHVSGFKGDRLVNSFFQGDRTTGKLTSPPIKIERDFLAFLIGGGGYEQKTCINLLLENVVVRTAVGPNTEPGGSEQLEPHFWDVRDLKGKTIKLEIVDQATGGWGHINVDHFVLTDSKPQVSNRNLFRTRDVVCKNQFLLFPIRTGARPCRVDVQVDGHNVREFDAELALTAEEADFWSFLDITSFKNKTATLRVKGISAEGLALFKQSDKIPGSEEFYSEALRPQFHFSQKLGWNNDPNGMVYYDGEWHLYFQHNPYGWKWGNMHWGHAVSKDLVHWRQLPIAIYNKQRGDWAFSGGAVVDEHNTTGWQIGDDKVIVASWTSTGRGECLAYSTDRGRTFTEHAGNPVVKHGGRDPKIIWYELGQHWVMAVYDESPQFGKAIAFYTSADMKKWELQSKLKGYYECPELLQLPVDNDESNTKWVIFAADARYAIGTFDGKMFTPQHEGKHQLHYGSYYASQVFSNAPGNRHIQIGWARINMPQMPFNQTFSFPHELSLRSTKDGIRLFAEPVKEIEVLHRKKHSIQNQAISPTETANLKVAGDILDIRATFAIGSAKSLQLDIGGEHIRYDVRNGQLSGATLRPVDGRVAIQVLVDRPMVEIIGNNGRVVITKPRQKHGDVSLVRALADGGDAQLVRLDVYELESIWTTAQ